ncbi:MAG: glycosyltransferase [Chloroflexota bacterium]|nr:glycosyltransferase [Chloroflexota bacterium]
MRGADNLLMIAARQPIPGQVKTRLGAAIGMEAASTLYEAFLYDLAVRFTPSEILSPRTYDLAWAYTPAECDFPRLLAKILGAPSPDHVRYVAQKGEGWGERQSNLMRWGSASGYTRTVLIASDSPQLPDTMPADAFAVLDDHDVAIGRVDDGGYYLIGLRAFHDVFSGVPMSTVSAAGALVQRAKTLNLSVAELSTTFDIDEGSDLTLLTAALAPSGAICPATWSVLRQLGLLDAQN